MRKLLAVMLLAVLVPAAAAAQKVPPVKNAPTAQPGDDRPATSQAQAMAAALQAVRGELQKGTLLHTWPVKSDGAAGATIPPASVTASGALFNPTGGKNGTPVWVVGVSSPRGQGTLRVLVDARSGAVVAGAQAASFSWGAFQWGVAPAYWQQGLNSPPPAKTNSPPPARSN